MVSRLPVACAQVGIAPDSPVGGVVEKSGRYDGTADGVPFGQDLSDGSRVPGGYGGPYVWMPPTQFEATTVPSTVRVAPLEPPEHFVKPLLVHARTSDV